MRIGTANMYDNALDNLTARQNDLAASQEQLTSGKRVLRSSDDPVAASVAERATTRIERIKMEQRTLSAQRDTISQIESTLGSANVSLQRFRELTVQAGSAAMSANDRTSLVQEMRGLRDEILKVANSTNIAGLPLFSGLGSNGSPFVDNATSVDFQGIRGQASASDVSLPISMDGHVIFENIAKDNGYFNITGQSAAAGQIWTDQGQVTNPTTFTAGNDYTVQFTTVGPTTTYTVSRVAPAAVLAAAQPYTAGQTIAINDPLDPTHTLSFATNGSPQTGDTLTIGTSALARPPAQATMNVFEMMDSMISTISNAPSTQPGLTQAIQNALVQIDASINRMSSARTQAGALLNRADSISNSQETRTLQLENDRVRSEDLDMVSAISDFQNKQTGYEAALKSYAQVQRLSLFNYFN
ncbi:MAG: flagellar hook-associated protein FlgL [Gammaproteobacteria bacterium]|jgi:flagellar hook-associated protein 3 FlgL|nr:flagellar hook-associated protein FlgL [Gammaproteobacteria bacterium]MBU0785935.1 flagellar hook-associated protein FlgL [Gammaproteobacteria bacterium]MBU0816548.1 flagellar hook-associated protein FlgL [Gammaproteobacteria bacterium]MBU1788349.1 flagellar hook-associated protein FlgL [Gammaproteobacteria bacterium]